MHRPYYFIDELFPLYFSREMGRVYRYSRGGGGGGGGDE